MRTLTLTLLWIFLICFLFGCTEQTRINLEATEKEMTKLENEEKSNQYYMDYPLTDEELYDFYFINVAPISEERQPLSEIIKVYFSEWTIDESYSVAINIENNELLMDVAMDSLGLNSYDSIMIKDAEKVINILEKHDIQNWQHYYSDVKDTTSYEDGASWNLMFQYKDGSTFRIRGKGLLNITPDNYGSFVTQLKSFVEDSIASHK